MPECGFCKDCKWWSKDFAPWERPEDDCKGHCTRARSEAGREDKQSLAIAREDDGWLAWLETLPDFGCVQFEAKP